MDKLFRAVLVSMHGTLGPLSRKVFFLDAPDRKEAMLKAKLHFEDELSGNTRGVGLYVDEVRFYPNAIREISKNLFHWFPDAEPRNSGNTHNYRLWMIDQMQNLEKTKEGSVQAAQWIGSILGFMEAGNWIGREKAEVLLKKDFDGGYI